MKKNEKKSSELEKLFSLEAARRYFNAEIWGILAAQCDNEVSWEGVPPEKYRQVACQSANKAEKMYDRLKVKNPQKWREFMRREYGKGIKQVCVSSLDSMLDQIQGGVIAGIDGLSEHVGGDRRTITRCTSEGFDYEPVKWKTQCKITAQSSGDQLKLEMTARMRDGRTKKRRP